MLTALLRLLGIRREAVQPPAPPGPVPVLAVGEAAQAASPVSAALLRRPALPATMVREEQGAELPRCILRDAIDPALATLAQIGIRSDDRARRLLLAIAGQEGDWQHRRQFNDGPARGLWQFERGGGVQGVLTHRATAQAAARFCRARGVQPVAQEVWEALERDDVLAAGIARLLLYSDPAPLPEDQQGGWECYLRLWRPGKPAPERWPGCWQTAGEALGEAVAA